MMTESALQSLDTEQITEFLRPFENMLDAGTLAPDAVSGVFEAVKLLPADAHRDWMRRYKFKLLQALHGTRCRSTTYYMMQMSTAALVLHKAGLIDIDNGYRDRDTGRKVKTLVGELSRITWANDEALIGTYVNLRDEPLDAAKAVVRDYNRRARWHSPKFGQAA